MRSAPRRLAVDDVLIGSLVASSLRVSAPLTLCALASVLAERSGVIDLGLEGKMLFAAFAAGAAGGAGGAPPGAVLAAWGAAGGVFLGAGVVRAGPRRGPGGSRVGRTRLPPPAAPRCFVSR